METSLTEDFVSKSQNAAETPTESVTMAKKKVFQPEDVQSVKRLLEAVTVTDRFTSFQPKKLVFTKFGLSLAPMTAVSSSTAIMPYGTRRLLSYSPPKSVSTASISMAKIGSPTSSPIARTRCHCKQSKCLKLYCECFASGMYCDGCGCTGCRNKVEAEAARQVAVQKTLLRNPNAFEPKIASTSSLSGAEDNGDDDEGTLMMGKHNRGCNCTRTGCVKKYCECYRANILCSENCKCMDCKNYEGSEERMAFCGEDQTIKIHIEQVNASISSAVGSSGYSFSAAYRKRDFLKLTDSCDKKPPIPTRSRSRSQVKAIRASPIYVVHGDPVGHIYHPPALCSSLHLPRRSSLADINYTAITRELCSDLVITSVGCQKRLANIAPMRQELKENKNPNVLTTQEVKNCQANVADIIDRGANKSSGVCEEVESQRPVLSDKKDNNLFKGAAATTLDHISHNDRNSDVHAEQERLVLVHFLNCLRKLVNVQTLNKNF